MKALLVALVSLSIVTAVILAILVAHFYPSRRVELAGPVGTSHRLFVKSTESPDGSLSVYASDWPYTFAQPLMIGEAGWDEKYLFSEYYWSADGSIIVFRNKEKDSPFTLNMAAYDFKNHRLIDLEALGWNRAECDRLISELVESRGGRSSFVVEIPDLKSGRY